MKTVCLGAETVPGFDVSQWQPNPDFAGLKAKGMGFGLVRATNGLTVDTYFQRHWTAAKAVGLIVGAYCYFHPLLDPDAQAALALKTVGDVKGTLGIVPDCEETEGVAPQMDSARVIKFMQDVDARIMYGSPYYIEALGLPAEFATKYALWVAEYGPVCPQIPSPFSIATIWQWSTSGNQLDVNKFNGNMTQLQKMVI